MDRRASEDGQASVDLVATIPALLLVVLIAVQLVALGYGLWSAATAARTGARAAYVGGDGRRQALGALPDPLRAGATVRAGDPVAVRVSVPSLVPGVPALPVEARAALGPGKGAGRG